MASTRGRDPAVEEEFLGALYKGGELLASGKIVEAREHLEKAHVLAPKNEKAQNLLGLTYFKLGLFDRASEVYEKLVNENPADATLRVNLGLVYLKTNNLERCIKEFETATDLEPTHKKAHNYLGLALAQQGTYAKAKEHFELAGSEQMAEKMSRAIANASSPSGIHTPVARQGPKTVVLGEDDSSSSASSSYRVPLGEGDPSASSVYRAMKLPVPEKTAPPPPPPTPVGEEEAIEVMSDEEVPSEAFVVPEDAVIPAEAAPPPPPDTAVENDDALNSDWGAALPSSPGRASVDKKPAPPSDEMRFAEDEGPSFPGSRPSSEPSEAEMPVLDAVVDVEASEPMPEANGAVVEIEATVEVMPDTPLDAPLETATEVEVEPDEILGDDAIIDAPPEPEPEPVAVAPAEPPPPAPVPSVPSPAWLTESQDPPPPADAPAADQHWVAAPAADVAPEQPAPPAKRKWAAADAEVSSWGTTSSGAETAPTDSSAEQLAADAPAIAPLEMPALGPVTSPSQITEAPAEPPAVAPASDDSSWATGAAESAAQAVAAEAIAESPPEAAEYAASSELAMESLPSTVDDASWATGGAVAAVPPQPEVFPTTPDDDSWATGAASAEAVQADARTEWATEQVADVEASFAAGAGLTPSQPVRAAAPQPALDPVPEAIRSADESADLMAQPAPSAPLPITVEEPAEAPTPIIPPAGYSAMQPQRLVDLGANGAWVHEPSAGPFHLSVDGLAVTIAGEMLMRMGGLIAVVGSINVNPEHRRRRGRPTQEPFGAGQNQLQRVTGNGVVYLEPGRSKFHAVDLTDQNGVNIDDDGAYLREELVFAFEEPISYENGKLSNEAQALELAHLKGTGRVLLQLDGTLRAMPIPVAAPLVVPVQRVVGWFGRVTPRLMGFGGRGAVELTGEGYALLGTPSERA